MSHHKCSHCILQNYHVGIALVDPSPECINNAITLKFILLMILYGYFI